jgi:hypothetical protein
MTNIHIGRGTMTDIELIGKLHDGTAVAYRFPGSSEVEFDGVIQRGQMFGDPTRITLRNPDEILAIDMTIRARRHAGLPHIMETRMVDTTPKPTRPAKPDPTFYEKRK